MSKEETLEQRIRREALEYRSRWSDCNGDVEESDIAGVRPLVERIVGLERTQQRSATDSEREMAEMRDKLTAAQTAGRDQASEIERLRGALADANETIKGADESRKGYVAEIQRLKLYVDALKADLDVARAALLDDDEIERLTTTIDVLAGRLAARGQS